MTLLRHGFAVSIVIGTSLLSGASTAWASDPTVADCIGASESAIKLKLAHQLRDAREKLLVCASPKCPSEVQVDCERRASEVSAAIPTIVFEAKDTYGDDVADVKVTMDGALLLEGLDGTAVPLDPGPHTFTFESAKGPPIERRLVLLENEKGRREVINFSVAAAVRPAWHVTFKGDAPGWTLVDTETNQLLCELPCSRTIGDMDRVELRYYTSGGGVEKISVPPFRSRPVSEPITVSAKHSTGSLALDVTLLSVGGAAAFAGLLATLVGGVGTCSSGAPTRGTCPDGTPADHSALAPGLVATGVGVVGGVLGFVLLKVRTRGGTDVTPPASGARDASIRIESIGPGWLTGVF